MNQNTTTIEQRISDLSPALRRYAAHHTGTPYAPELDRMAPEAQDLYQVAVAEIIRTSKPEDNRTYLLRLADWRMRHELDKGRTYTRIVSTEADVDDEIIDLVVTEEIDPETIVIERETALYIQEILDDMPAESQQIVRMLRSGIGLPEISRRMGTSYTTTHKRLIAVRSALAGAGISPAMVMA